MQIIWAQLDDLSFFTINTMISVSIPGIANTILSVLLNFIQFDILFTEKWLPQALSKLNLKVDDQKDEPLSFFLGENGYQSKLLMINLGSGLIFITLYTFCFLFILALEPLASTFPM